MVHQPRASIAPAATAPTYCDGIATRWLRLPAGVRPHAACSDRTSCTRIRCVPAHLPGPCLARRAPGCLRVALMPRSFPEIDDGDGGTAAVGALVHGVDRHEHGRVADGGRGDAADRGLDVAVPGHVGVVEHDLPATAQERPAVGLALHEAV